MVLNFSILKQPEPTEHRANEKQSNMINYGKPNCSEYTEFDIVIVGMTYFVSMEKVPPTIIKMNNYIIFITHSNNNKV